MRPTAAFTMILLSLSTTAQSQAPQCDLSPFAKHGEAVGGQIRRSQSGLPAIYYQANLDVNTDGSGRSYHPDDPRGAGPAINNMGNAIATAHDAAGQRITCKPRSGACYDRFIKAFEGARDIDYNPRAFPCVSFGGIIPTRMDEKLGWPVPCTNPSGPYQGFFVSQTSAVTNPALGLCDQARYLDALAVNANVLPLGTRWASQGIATDGFDLVIVRDITTGKIEFAVNGDRGPAAKLGEGSVRLAAAFAGKSVAVITNYQQARALARSSVQYLIFPNIDLKRLAGGQFTQADVDRIGAEHFGKWGGEARLRACQK